MLGNVEMMIAEFCNLGQMGNADNLVMFGKRGKFFTHNLCHTPSDTGVNLIKYNGLSVWASIAFSASTTRESSPPETMLDSGLRGSPTFGAIKKTAWSIPVS